MRVLHITSELDGGGVDSLLYNYCSRLITDVKFDFIVTSSEKGILEQPLIDLGCNVYHVSQIRDGFFRHQKQVEKIIKKGNYDIVHDHSGYKSFINLWIARKYDIKIRIAHAHQAFIVETFKSKFIRKIATYVTKIFATSFFACGEDAAKWMWGERKVRNNDVYIMTNAIDVSNFEFQNNIRNYVRKELGIEDKFVIGNVARFSFQKNHEFLIKMFSVLSKNRSDVVLVLVGRGELFDEMKNLAKKEGVYDKILFLGVRKDVSSLMNAFDLFVLPSYYEGLPVTLVEVQANGLPAIVSSSITTEIKKSDNIFYYSLEYGLEKWAKYCSEINLKRACNNIKNTDYDINVASRSLKLEYLRLLQ